ncbi:MAG: lysylphosphatidylglycerol synthase domain-containing protein [Candidatus Caldarchaeum sp.]|nr:lysylphosphatidylglycerol synthase domain-containing protein [Candidatus Caldarchaeum sp.]
MHHIHLGRSIAGILLTLGIFLLVLNIFRVSPEEILSLSPSVLVYALLINFGRFAAQAVRLHVLLRKFSNLSVSYYESFAVRAASEFFALTTVPFLADEAARTWLLAKRGMRSAKAFGLAFIELVLDTAVGSAIAFAASLHAFAANATGIGLIILTLSSAQILISFIIIGLGRRSSEAQSQDRAVKFLKHLRLPTKVRDWLSDGSEEVKQVVRDTFSPSNIKTLTFLLASTAVVMSAPALILYLQLGSIGSTGFLASLFSFHSGNVLGVLPVTVGGAGLTEAGVYIYLRTVYGINSAATVVQWRIATYYVSLIFSGVMFLVAFSRRGNN